MSARVVKPGETILGGSQTWIPPYRVEVDGLGDLSVHHAAAVNVGWVDVEGVRRIQLMLCTPGCPCGCGKPGIALHATPEPAHARMIAAALIDFAGQMEDAAGRHAAAALAKAAGK